MVLSKGVKKCYGLLLVLFITFLFSFGVCSGDVNAQSLNTSSFDLLYKQPGQSSYGYRTGIYAGFSQNTVLDPGAHIRQYQINTVQFQAGGNFASLHFETNIVATSYFGRFNPWVNLPYQNIIVCNSSPAGVSVNAKNLSYATTHWTSTSNNFTEYNNTLTFYGDVVLKGFTQGTNYTLTCSIGNTDHSFYEYSGGSAVWFEQNPMTILFTNNETDNLLNIQVNQNETIINQNNEYYQHEYDAENNISSQQASDIPNSQNQQTTNIISVLSGFLTALQSVQATNCTLTLPFPSFAGGSTTVDVCDGKQYAPTIVSVGSSLLLITLFIPLAYILLRMIYNEIRSWTNG